MRSNIEPVPQVFKGAPGQLGICWTTQWRYLNYLFSFIAAFLSLSALNLVSDDSVD
jgi:hypothetical protein